MYASRNSSTPRCNLFQVTWYVGMQFSVLFFVEIVGVFATLNLFGDNLVAGFLKTQVCNSQSSLLQLRFWYSWVCVCNPQSLGNNLSPGFLKIWACNSQSFVANLGITFFSMYCNSQPLGTNLFPGSLCVFCNCQSFFVANLGNTFLSRWLQLFVSWVTILGNRYAILSPLCCNCVLNGHSWVCDRNPRSLGTNVVPKSQSSLLAFCKLTFLSMWLQLDFSYPPCSRVFGIGYTTLSPLCCNFIFILFSRSWVYVCNSLSLRVTILFPINSWHINTKYPTLNFPLRCKFVTRCLKTNVFANHLYACWCRNTDSSHHKFLQSSSVEIMC